MKLIEFDRHTVEHNLRGVEYWVTEGIVINDITYAVVQLRYEEDGIHAILTHNNEFFDQLVISTDVINFDIQSILDKMTRMEQQIKNMEEELRKIKQTQLQDRGNLELVSVKDLSLP